MFPPRPLVAIFFASLIVSWIHRDEINQNIVIKPPAAYAQMGPVGQIAAFPPKQPAPSSTPTWSNFSSAVNGACGSALTCALTGLTIGSGLLVVGEGNQNGGTISGLALSGCGTAALSKAADSGLTGSTVALWQTAGSITGGTGCTLTITAASGIILFDAAWGSLNNLSSTTAGSTCALAAAGSQGTPYTCTSSLTVSSGGFGVSVGWQLFNNSAMGCATPATCDVAQQDGTASAIALSHLTANGTPSFTDGNFSTVGVAGAAYR